MRRRAERPARTDVVQRESGEEEADARRPSFGGRERELLLGHATQPDSRCGNLDAGAAQAFTRQGRGLLFGQVCREDWSAGPDDSESIWRCAVAVPAWGYWSAPRSMTTAWTGDRQRTSTNRQPNIAAWRRSRLASTIQVWPGAFDGARGGAPWADRAGAVSLRLRWWWQS